MCINIWQKFHLLHRFSIGLMHEASVLKVFEWKLQKRAELEKGCRKDWAAGRAAGKLKDGSLVRAGGFGGEAGVSPPGRTCGTVHSPQTFQGRLPSLPLPSPSSSSLIFLSSYLKEQMGLRGEVVRVENRREMLSWFFFPTSAPGRRELSLPIPHSQI